MKCYGEAKDEDWTEKDTYENCKRVVDHLKSEKSEHKFCLWYHDRAKEQKGLAVGLAEKIQRTPILNQEGKIDYYVTKLYKASGVLTNYISGPIGKWDEFSEPSSSVFLLALYQSIQDKPYLLPFPPPGLLSMDVPVKISVAKLSIHIEIGEIKSSDESKAIKKAKLQLQRSLLCFKWLDELLSNTKTKMHYGLIGKIFINGNCSALQKKGGSKNIEDKDFEDGIVIKQKYKFY